MEIRALAHLRHAQQHLRKCPPLRPAERFGQNGSMFGLGAPAIGRRLLAQALNDSVIHVTHQKICHDYLHPDLLSMIAPRRQIASIAIAFVTGRTLESA
ncbi:hypothetical protein BCPG_03171 [Burkholderia cenocepacia PC184]|nr:hypothetical protein BCPG_03171 [Burkholderia cenocepacia PC184]